jgi:hypothetical protein
MEAMTGPEDRDREALDRLQQALIEDILATSDDDILAEAAEEGIDPEAAATANRALFEKALAINKKARLEAAKAAVAADRRRALTVLPSNPIEARRLLARLLKRHPKTSGELTMAARKGQGGDLSDAEVYSFLEDFRDLGIDLSDAADDEN